MQFLFANHMSIKQGENKKNLILSESKVERKTKSSPSLTVYFHLVRLQSRFFFFFNGFVIHFASLRHEI